MKGTRKLYVITDEKGKNYLTIENDEKGRTSIKKVRTWTSATHYNSYDNAFNAGATELEMGTKFGINEIKINDYDETPMVGNLNL